MTIDTSNIIISSHYSRRRRTTSYSIHERGNKEIRIGKIVLHKRDHEDYCLCVQSIRIKSEYQRQGFGTLLMQKAARKARRGREFLIIDSPESHVKFFIKIAERLKEGSKIKNFTTIKKSCLDGSIQKRVVYKTR